MGKTVSQMNGDEGTADYARSTPDQAMEILSQLRKWRSNGTSPYSKTSGEKLVPETALAALKKQEELQARLEKIKNQAKLRRKLGDFDQLAGDKEIVELEKPNRYAGTARFPKKKMKGLKASKMVGSDFEVYLPFWHERTI